MIEGNPLVSGLGITQKDSSGIVLPSLQETTVSIRKEPQPGHIVVRSVPYEFYRERGLLPQEQFSDKVRNIVLPPIRGELDNGNLANFLWQLNNQKGFDSQDKLGVVLLINDNAKDRDEGKHVVAENRMVSKYVALLGIKDIEGIGQLDMPQEHKDLAKEIIDKDKLEIRQDFVHATEKIPHFGLLRLQLFDEAKVFKNSGLPDNEVVLHLSDIDVTYSQDHFQTLREFYADPSHDANLSEQDFLPGIHEGEKEEDISRDLLKHLDDFRLYRYGQDTYILLNGVVASGTPIISGRLSYFDSKPMYDKNDFYAQTTLEYKMKNEDCFIGSRMRAETPDFVKTVGNVGEVYRGHRALTPEKVNKEEEHYNQWGSEGQTDAEEAFTIIYKIRKGMPILGLDRFSEGDEYLNHIEYCVSEARNQVNEQDSHSADFKESDEYRNLLQSELRQGQAKVRLRRMRLMNYVDSLAGGKELSDTEQKIADPYIEYFQDETEEMKRQLAEGKTPEQVAVGYISKYDSFFNPDTSIHAQIARVRALKKYVFAHDLK